MVQCVFPQAQGKRGIFSKQCCHDGQPLEENKARSLPHSIYKNKSQMDLNVIKEGRQFRILHYFRIGKTFINMIKKPRRR